MEFLIYSIEDDKNISHIINKALSKQGYIVESFFDAKSFFEKFYIKKPHMILLDMMLPDMSGTDVLKKIRSNQDNDDIQIIIISANHMIMDKVDGLDLGADDYIEKPFDLLELMSRVGAKLRRLNKGNLYSYDGLVLDINKHVCKVDNQEVDLTLKEFEILKLLFQKKGLVVTRDEMFESIWETNQFIESRTLDMHIKSLRTKLGSKNYLIKTIYGVGYKLNL